MTRGGGGRHAWKIAVRTGAAAGTGRATAGLSARAGAPVAATVDDGTAVPR
jgi:NADP-dependent 3-hydroxy acid dehydrogenase YdfG